ncbi:MAG: GntR family transcriptional regulator, partial [Bacteroidales bacterium]
IYHSTLITPIYEKVKSMILSNELKPGQKIIQEKIASELGVSRTPLNKALQMLEFEMLLQSVPRKGIYVKEISLNEMLDVFDVREGIEGVAARLVASKKDPTIAIKLKKVFEPFIGLNEKIKVTAYRSADTKFHSELINLAGNTVLSRLYFFDNLSSKIIQMGLVRPPEETLLEHLNIIEAIRINEPEQAAKEAALHIRISRDLIASLIKERKELQWPE